MAESGGTREECKAYVDEVMSHLLNARGVRLWWDTPIHSMHDDTPNDLLNHGFTLVLRQLVDEYMDEGFA